MSNNQRDGERIKRQHQLQQLVDEHPYYAIGQLDLLKSFESNRTPAFHQQAAKTALFFSNTYWLSWQLQAGDEGDDTDEQPEKSSNDNNNIVDEKQEVRIEKDEEPVENKPVTLPPIEVSITNQDELQPISSSNETNSDTHAKTSDSGSDEIAFEPLHTVDYFASQGIKLTEEPISNDKLGQQMKSFTAWLKSMKKIHAQKLPAGDEQTDRRIQGIADESNSNADVFTEAMAEVYQKQGKTDKAIEVYTKLSLIYPAKSAYFAAKIESLKAS